MPWMNNIIVFLNDASGRFYDIYLQVFNWAWPYRAVSGFFYSLCLIFNNLSWQFYYFATWLYDLQSQIGDTLDWDAIWLNFYMRLPNLTLLNNWFYNWVTNIRGVIDDWWATWKGVVGTWVQSVRDLATSLFNQANAALVALQSSWDNFKTRIPSIDQLLSWWSNWQGNVLTVVNSWWSGYLQLIQDMINSAFTARESLWSGWQDWRSAVSTFFADPVEYLWGGFTDWFLGPEV